MPHLVDLVRGHGGRGRGLERPAIIFVAVRARPHARVVRGDGALGSQFGDLPLERRGDILRCDLARRRRPVARDFLFPGAALDRFDQAAALARVLRRQLHLLDRLVEQEVRRHQAHGPRGTDPRELAVELLGIGLKPRQIGFGIGGGFDRMLGVEEARHVEIGADILDHDVGRVAPAADGDVAIGQGEALERGRVGAADDFDAGPDGVRQAGRVDRLGARLRSVRNGAASRAARAPSDRRADARMAARGPLSMPSVVALFGATAEANSRRSKSSSALACGVGGSTPRRRERAQRPRPGKSGAGGEGGNRLAAGKLRSNKTDAPSLRGRKDALGLHIQAIAVNAGDANRSPGCSGTAARAPFAVADPHAAAMFVDRGDDCHDFSDQPRRPVVQQGVAAVACGSA